MTIENSESGESSLCLRGCSRVVSRRGSGTLPARMGGRLFFAAPLVNNTLTNTCPLNVDVTDVLNYVLAASAAAALFFTLLSFFRLLVVSRQTGLRYDGKRFFHIVLAFSLLGRCAFFFVSPWICKWPPTPSIQLFIFFNHTLEILFFCAFFLLLIFWMDLIGSLRRDPSKSAARCQKLSLGMFFGMLMAVTVVFCALFFSWAGNDQTRVLMLDIFYSGVVDFLEVATVVMFIVFGLILYNLLRKHDALLTVNVEKKKQMARNIMIVTLLCALCFGFRVVTSVYSITREFDGAGGNAYDVPPPVFFLYFFLPEICGSLLMLVLLRIPRKEGPPRSSNIQDYKRII